MKRIQFPTAIFVMLLAAISLASCAKPEKHLDLNVMSFNIRTGYAKDGENRWEMRRRQLFDLIRRHAPDLVGLQEANRFQIDEIRKALPQYAEIGEGRDGGKKGEYSAILYNADRFDLPESGTFWLSDTPEVPSTSWGNKYLRICTWGHFTDRSSGQSFYFYNTHLDHRSQPSREKATQLIAETIQKRTHPDPAILAGDFNAGEDNPAIEYLAEVKNTKAPAHPLLVDTFRILHPAEKTVGTFNGFKGTTDGDKIDYIFATPDIQPLEATIIRDNKEGRYPSDHFPIGAKLRIVETSRK